MKLIEKILKSRRIESLAKKIHQEYDKVLKKFFIKYDLQNELKQGKIFTIILVALSFILISGVIFLLISSLLGLNLIVTIFQLLLKYIIIYIRWLYTITKTKGNVIKKYVKTLQNNSSEELEIEKNVTNNQNLELINELMNIISQVPSLSLKRELIVYLKYLCDLLLTGEINEEELVIEFDKNLSNYLEVLNKTRIVEELTEDDLTLPESESISYQKIKCRGKE